MQTPYMKRFRKEVRKMTQQDIGTDTNRRTIWEAAEMSYKDLTDDERRCIAQAAEALGEDADIKDPAELVALSILSDGLLLDRIAGRFSALSKMFSDYDLGPVFADLSERARDIVDVMKDNSLYVEGE